MGELHKMSPKSKGQITQDLNRGLEYILNVGRNCWQVLSRGITESHEYVLNQSTL